MKTIISRLKAQPWEPGQHHHPVHGKPKRTDGLDSYKAKSLVVIYWLHICHLGVRPRITRHLPTTDQPLPPHHQIHCRDLHGMSHLPGHHSHLRGWHAAHGPVPRQLSSQTLHHHNLSNKLRNHLLARGYEENSIDCQIQKATLIPHTQALQPCPWQQQPRHIPLVATYYPRLTTMTKIVKKHLPILHTSWKPKQAISNPPLVTHVPKEIERPLCLLNPDNTSPPPPNQHWQQQMQQQMV